MKGLHGGIPLAVLAAVARAHADVIGGAHGLDSGNAGGVSTDNGFGRAKPEVNKDDHHVDIKTETKVDVDVGPHRDHYWHHWRPDSPPHGHKPRGDRGDTLIAGPGGVDSGNSASIPTENKFASFYNEKNKDDHSAHAKAEANVDIDNRRRNDRDGHEHHHEDRPHHEGRPHHNEKPHHHERPHHKDGPVTLIDGPGGVDSGNSASIPTENQFASVYDEKNKDDHSVDLENKWKYKYDVHGHPYPVPVPGHPWKRDPSHRHEPATLIGGPHGFDSGNSASVPTENEFASMYHEKNKDDHSVDLKNKWKYKYDVHGHPYPVPVPGHPWKRDPSHRHEPATLIGGSHGFDSGNSASVPTENEFASFYKEHNHDDHSVGIDQKYSFEYDNRPEPFPVPVPGYPHHWKARSGRGSGIAGPGGVDIGDSVSIPTKNKSGHGYSETNIDDHAVDIDQKTNVDIDHEYPYPVPVPAHHRKPHHHKGRQHGKTAIDGSKGLDSGNDVSIPTKSEFGVDYKEHNRDDHSVHVDSKTNVDVDSHPYPVPVPVPGHHHHAPFPLHARGGVRGTGIDGPGGFDSGNDFAAPTHNKFASVYDENNRDDHSFTGKASADVDIEHHVPYPVPKPVHHHHHWKARSRHSEAHDTTLIDGPGGIDAGNDADISSTNSFLSDYDELNKDDHSFTGKAKADVDIDYESPFPVPVPAHFWKPRGEHEPPVTLIGGPNGIDSGNSADAGSVNSVVSDYDEFNKDDHSVDEKAKPDYDIHYRRSVHGQVGGDLISGPGGADAGNDFDAPTSNHANTAYDEDNEDDHSVGLAQETDVDVDQEYAYPVPVPVPEPHHPHPEPHPKYQPEPHPKHDSEPHPKHDSEPHPKYQPEPHPKHDSEPHPKHEPEPHHDHESEPHHEHEPEPHHDHESEPHHEHEPEPKHEGHPGRPAPGPVDETENDPKPAPASFNAPSADIQFPQEAPKADIAPEPVSQPNPKSQESRPTAPSINFPAAGPTTPQEPPSGDFNSPQPGPAAFPQEQQKQPSVPSGPSEAPVTDESPEESDTNERAEASNDEPEADDNSDSVDTSEPPASVPSFNPQASNTQNGFQGFGQGFGQDAAMTMPSFNPSTANGQNGFPQGFGQGAGMAMPSFNPSASNPQNGLQGFGQGSAMAMPSFNPSTANEQNGFPQGFGQGAGGAPAPSSPFGNPGSQAPSPMTSTVVVPRASSFERIPIDVPQSQTGSSVHASSARTVVVHTTDDSAPTSSAASTGGPITSRAETVFTGGAAQFTPHAGVFSVVCGVAALLAFVL